MKMKRLLAISIGLAVLATVSAYAQPFPPKGDDNTGSFGMFQIRIEDKFAHLFAGCPGFDPVAKTLTSPTLYDPVTKIGRSGPVKEDSPQDDHGVPVGSAGTVIGEHGGPIHLVAPPGFPPSSAGTREVHTEIRSLKMSTFPAPPPGSPLVMVRAGVWYNSASSQSPPAPQHVSPGEVKSKSSGGVPANDFPARSYFDVFSQVDIPACGTAGFPGATVYNRDPLMVDADNLTGFPPSGVVYMHDVSSIVSIKFLTDHGRLWHKNERLGCFQMAGHGIGFTPAKARPAAVKQGAEKFHDHIRGEERDSRHHHEHREGCGPKKHDDD